MSFTKNEVYRPSVENGGSGDTWATARNYLDGTYGQNYANTKIMRDIQRRTTIITDMITKSTVIW